MGLVQNLQRGILRPEARDDAYTIDENGATTVDPLQNDAANYPLLPFARAIVYVDTNDFLGTVEVVDNRAHLKIDPGTAYDYLSEGETATATIIYGMQNALGYRDRAEITITITGQNDAPDAQDVDVLTTEAAIGSFSGPDGITITPVFTDPDANDTHTVSIASTSGYALVQVNPDGTIQYYTGAFDYLVGEGETITDTFTYTVTDNHGASDTATVTLTIEGDNDAPVDFETEAGLSPFGINTAGVVSVFEATDGSPEEGSTHSVQSTRADFFDDVNDTQTIAVSFAGSELNNAASTIGALGTVSAVNEQPDPASPRHVYGIDIDVSDTALDFLGEGDVLRQTYDYTITDQHGASATYEFYAHFYGANDAPDAQDVSGTVGEDGPGVTITADFTDPDINDTHTLSFGEATGSVTDNGDGTFSYDPNGQFESLAEGESATDTFTYTVEDNHGGSDTATVTVTIEGADDDATITGDTTGAVTDDNYVPASGKLTVIDPDHDQSSFQAVAPEVLFGGTYGYFSFDEATGEWEYRLLVGSSNVDRLGVGETAVDTLTVTSLDGSASETITVTVTGANDAVYLEAEDLTYTVNENFDYSISGWNFFQDRDLNDEHIVSYELTQSHSMGQVGSFSIPASLDDSYQFQYDYDSNAAQFLAEGEEIVEKYTVTVDDQNGSAASHDITFHIVGENDAPTVDDTVLAGVVSETEGPFGPAQLTFEAEFSFSDVDLIDTHNISWSANGAVLGTLVLNVSGKTVTGTYSVDQDLLDALDQGDTRTDNFTITIDDQNGGTVTKDIAVTIDGADEPVLITGFETGTDSDVGNSDSHPFVSTDVMGDGNIDWFRVDIAEDNTIVTFDIDDADELFSAPAFDSAIRLYNESGNQVGANNDSSVFQGGTGSVGDGLSTETLDSYLSLTLDAGSYYLSVERVGQNPVPAGADYELQVSINRNVIDFETPDITAPDDSGVYSIEGFQFEADVFYDRNHSSVAPKLAYGTNSGQQAVYSAETMTISRDDGSLFDLTGLTVTSLFSNSVVTFTAYDAAGNSLGSSDVWGVDEERNTITFGDAFEGIHHVIVTDDLEALGAGFAIDDVSVAVY